MISRAVSECTLLIELVFNTMYYRQSKISTMSLAEPACVCEYPTDITHQDIEAPPLNDLQDELSWLGAEIGNHYLDDWHGCFEQHIRSSAATCSQDDAYIENLCTRIAEGEVDIMTFFHEMDVFLHSDTP